MENTLKTQDETNDFFFMQFDDSLLGTLSIIFALVGSFGAAGAYLVMGTVVLRRLLACTCGQGGFTPLEAR